jgi:hypothetical protein
VYKQIKLFESMSTTIFQSAFSSIKAPPFGDGQKNFWSKKLLDVKFNTAAGTCAEGVSLDAGAAQLVVKNENVDITKKTSMAINAEARYVYGPARYMVVINLSLR